MAYAPDVGRPLDLEQAARLVKETAAGMDGQTNRSKKKINNMNIKIIKGLLQDVLRGVPTDDLKDTEYKKGKLPEAIHISIGGRRRQDGNGGGAPRPSQAMHSFQVHGVPSLPLRNHVLCSSSGHYVRLPEMWVHPVLRLGLAVLQ